LTSLEDSKARLGTDVGRKLNQTQGIFNQNNTITEKPITQLKMKITRMLAFGYTKASSVAMMQPLLQAGFGSPERRGINFSFFIYVTSSPV